MCGACRGKAQRSAAGRGSRDGAERCPACRLRSALDGRGRTYRRGRRRRDHRHQHGLPGEARHQWRVRVGADARPRSCAHADRSGGASGRRAGDAEDAAWLGRPLAQRAGAGKARGGGRRRARHRAWPHALPILQRPRRLGRGARGQTKRVDPGRGQRRYRKLRRCRRGAGGIRRRRGDGRPRRAG